MFVECNPDEVIVRYLTGLSRKRINHEYKGKAEICVRSSKLRDEIGLVDQDPDSVHPRYLKNIRLSGDLVSDGILVYVDDDRNNKLVVLKPKLEDWILRAAHDSGLNLHDYGLPTRPSTLHREINGKLDNFSRLLDDLTHANSVMLIKLKELLS